MLWVWTLLVACGPHDVDREGPAEWLPLSEHGRAWVYEATPACGCADVGLQREHTLETGRPAALHRTQLCTDCGELAVRAWLLDSHDQGIEAWGVISSDGERLHQPPVLMEDETMLPGEVLSTETLDGLWLSELVAWEACPADHLPAECARYQVQHLGGSGLFPAGTWWLARGVGMVAFTEGSGAEEAEWVLVD